jgi:hypothetical protein
MTSMDDTPQPIQASSARGAAPSIPPDL